MSSDNGIYILKTPTKDKDIFEFRVIHAQDIEGIYWNNQKNDYQESPYAANLISYFGKEKVLTEEEADKMAFSLEKEIMSDDFCLILEYGINTIELEKPFDHYVEEAKTNSEKKY